MRGKAGRSVVGHGGIRSNLPDSVDEIRLARPRCAIHLGKSRKHRRLMPIDQRFRRRVPCLVVALPVRPQAGAIDGSRRVERSGCARVEQPFGQTSRFARHRERVRNPARVLVEDKIALGDININFDRRRPGRSVGFAERRGIHPERQTRPSPVDFAPQKLMQVYPEVVLEDKQALSCLRRRCSRRDSDENESDRYGFQHWPRPPCNYIETALISVSFGRKRREATFSINRYFGFFGRLILNALKPRNINISTPSGKQIRPIDITIIPAIVPGPQGPPLIKLKGSATAPTASVVEAVRQRRGFLSGKSNRAFQSFSFPPIRSILHPFSWRRSVLMHILTPVLRLPAEPLHQQPLFWSHAAAGWRRVFVKRRSSSE